MDIFVFSTLLVALVDNVNCMQYVLLGQFFSDSPFLALCLIYKLNHCCFDSILSTIFDPLLVIYAVRCSWGGCVFTVPQGGLRGSPPH